MANKTQSRPPKSMRRNCKSGACAAIHEAMEDLYSAGALDKLPCGTHPRHT